MNTTASNRHRRNTSPFLTDRPTRRFRFSRHSPAFTIVELLIVIVIIAVLAAITVVTYTGIQNRARASAASSALSQAAKKLELYKVDNSAYPTSTNLASAGITNTNDTTYQYTSDGTTYCLTATNVTVSYYLNSTTTSTPTAGGCPGHGVGGVAAITNLVSNPSVRVDSSGWYGVVSASGAFTSARISAVSGLSDLGITTAQRLTITTVPNTWWRNSYSYYVNVNAGQTYSLSAYIRPSVATQTGVIIIWRNASNGTIIESPSAWVTQTANTWERRSVTATAPSGAVSVRLDIGATSGAVMGATLDTTALMFEEGSTVHSYADGSSPNWVWNGTANASSSTGPAL